MALVIRGVVRRDTASLRELVMSRAEFAYFYYPTSAFTRSPTKQEPGLAWFLHLQSSQKGVSRLLDRMGGSDVRLVGSACEGEPRAEGLNRIWFDCRQTIALGADTTTLRLLGGVIERGGMYKAFSYANDF
jgi:hypothetical protein